MALRTVPPRVAPVYCASAIAKEWPRRDKRSRKRYGRVGLVLAVENAAGKFICGGCGKAVYPARIFRPGGRTRLIEQ